MSVFGFNTEPSTGGGDLTPIAKYDTRAGRIFRVDRTDTGQGFVNDPVDITRTFKAIFDLENLQTGWIDFNTGAGPDFALVPIGNPLPPRPGIGHKNGVRFMLKLSKECCPDKPIREMSGTAKAFLAGLEELYVAYQAQAAANPGKLPVVVLDDAVPVKSGSSDKQSTNYRPVFKITGWAPRGDLVFQPKNAPAAVDNVKAMLAEKNGPPSTGSTRVEPPKAKEPELADTDDFG